jgi:pyruvate dehydrogenase E2 component (dihydrolipoamide acetyltransferase)
MDFKLADIGEGTVEGEIVKWLVDEGEVVVEDQPLVEVMTDKANVEIPSPVAGTVAKIPWKVGDVVPVGSTLVVLDDGSAASDNGAGVPAAASAAPVAASAAASAAPATTTAPKSDPLSRKRVLATPATRAFARNEGVDIGQVPGSGPNGRVTKDDIRAFSPGSAGASAATGASTTAIPVPALVRGPEDLEERVPMVGMRRVIARQMALSVHTAAHFTYVEEVDMTALVALKDWAKAESAKYGVKMTFLPFIIKAVVQALREFPMLNSALDEQANEIVLKKYYHIGVATQGPSGLMVPVVKDCDRKTPLQIAADLAAVSERARQGKAHPDELRGSTFTITSLGKLGGVLATPILNHPEVAILGVHAIKQRPVVRGDEIVVAPIANLSCSFDHRVVDGYDGAMFVQRVVELLEDPRRMLMGMV